MIVIAVAAFLSSMLTFFSGFGLGTLLLPVFSLFFSLPTAIAITAIVHFLNNFFKLALMIKFVIPSIFLRFSVPSLVGAFFGSSMLFSLGKMQPLASYTFFGHFYQIEGVKLIIAILIVAFLLFEALPKLKQLSLDPKFLIPGGLLSGFFGGLSGHQGALRSVFLMRINLSKEQFIATNTSTACAVDITRIIVYSHHLSQLNWLEHKSFIFTAVSSAFLGSYFGNYFLTKLSIEAIRQVVSVFLICIAFSLAAGLI